MVAWGAGVVALGGMHGFFWGACMVFSGGHAWFFPGGMHGFFPGVGMRGFFWGACVVFSGGHAWFFLAGGMHRIRRDTVNERSVRILLECILVLDCFFKFLEVTSIFV